MTSFQTYSAGTLRMLCSGIVTKRFPLLFLILPLLFLVSCEKNGNNILRSKKRMDKQLQGVWERVKLEEKDIAEEWTFDKAEIRRVPLEGPMAGAVIDTATYTLQIKLFRTFMTLDGFKTEKRFNQKFDVIRLDGEALVLYSVPDVGGSFMLEFVKK